MNNLLYNVLSKYYKTLNKIGYVNDSLVYSILLYTFIVNYINEDYRGLITKEDYSLFKRVLYKLFGTDCLIPYPEYKEMIKLSNLNELTNRVKIIEKNIVETSSTITAEDMNFAEVDDIIIE